MKTNFPSKIQVKSFIEKLATIEAASSVTNIISYCSFVKTNEEVGCVLSLNAPSTFSNQLKADIFRAYDEAITE
jgi:hypothetical protein